MPITVPYKVMAQGYRLGGGGQSGGLRASVPYLVLWEHAFIFFNDVLGISSASAIGPVTNAAAHQFPPSPTLRAVSAEIEPSGIDGVTGPMLGLAPGEFWTHAVVTVQYETSSFAQSLTDDPGYLNQFDPANPITFCEQSFESAGKAETLKADGYEFDDGTKVTGDLVRITTETRLVLTFPRIPFLPWKRVQDYIGCLNDRTMLQCSTGTLLFESAGTKFSSTTVGLMGQQLTLSFTYQDNDWNSIPRPNSGVYALVRKKGDTSKRIYRYADLRALFL